LFLYPPIRLVLIERSNDSGNRRWCDVYDNDLVSNEKEFKMLVRIMSGVLIVGFMGAILAIATVTTIMSGQVGGI
jgi:hypothetical protein